MLAVAPTAQKASVQSAMRAGIPRPSLRNEDIAELSQTTPIQPVDG